MAYPQMSQQSYKNQLYTYGVCGALHLPQVCQGNKTFAEIKEAGWGGFLPT